MKIERGVVYDPTIHHWLIVILGAASYGLYRRL
jgi:hypothetical protein